MPLWTLKIELIASVLLPVVAIAMFRMRVVFVIVSFGLAAFVALAPWDVGGTLNYLSVFPLGACIVIVAPLATRYIPSDRWWLVVAVFGTILLLFGRNFFLADYQNHYNAREPIVVEAVGSALLIAACATRQNAFAFLRWPAVVWLGDISYSLYLLHFPIIALVAGVGGEMLGLRIFNGDRIVATGFLTLVVLPIALPAAAVSYRYVELPGIRLGKRLHARVERTNAVVRDAHTRRSLENEGI
jgi:peptidoglycan/LPS O-acetylase OafA/YrhL